MKETQKKIFSIFGKGNGVADQPLKQASLAFKPRWWFSDYQSSVSFDIENSRDDAEKIIRNEEHEAALELLQEKKTEEEDAWWQFC